MNLTETEKAYIAGLFDGEGSIGFYQRRDNIFVPNFRITNSDFRLGKWLHNRFGFGSFKIYERANRKTMWEWEIRGRNQIYELCKSLSPYLIVKKDQVDLLLDLLDAEQKAGCGPGIKPPDYIQMMRVDVSQKLKDLKIQPTQNIQ